MCRLSPSCPAATSTSSTGRRTTAGASATRVRSDCQHSPLSSPQVRTGDGGMYGGTKGRRDGTTAAVAPQRGGFVI